MENNGKVHKRNRISFSCISCRKRKSKCDKLKPTCTKCNQLNVPCVYDAEHQPAPRKPTKGAELIHELQKELDYWKTRAQEVGTTKKLPVLSKNEFIWNSAFAPEILDLPINICTFHDKLIIHKQMKYYHKPFSTLALLQRDPFLNILTGSLYGSTFTDLHIKSKIRQTGVILQEPESVEKPVHTFLEKIISKTLTERKKITNTTDPTILFASSFILEDCAEEDYPPVLRLLIDEIEQNLPDIEAITFYMSTFYKTIYPMFPYLNVTQFEGILDIILVRNGSRYRINLGSSSLRIKLEMLCIMMAALLLTYTSLTIKIDDSTVIPATYDIFEKNRVTENVLVCCERCLCLLNSSLFTNENVLCCLLYLKVIENLRPEIGDMVISQELIITLSSISEMSLVIGLHKDPGFYVQLKDSRIIDRSIQNYRRKMWLNVVAFTSHMLLTNGSDGRITLDHLICFDKTRNGNYLSIVKEQMTQADTFDFIHHDILYKQYQVTISLSELVSESSHLYKTTTIRRLLELHRRSKTILESNFPLSSLKNNDVNVNTTTENDEYYKTKITGLRPELGVISYNSDYVRKWKTFEVHIMARIVYLNICWGVCNFFETQERDTIPRYMKLFELYLIESHTECFELAKLAINYMTEEYDPGIAKNFHYSSDMSVVTLLVRLYLFLTSSILRCQKAEDHLTISPTSSSPDILKVRQAKDIMLKLLRNLVRISNKRLAHIYLTCQKANCLFEYIIHVIDIGKLSELSERFWNYYLEAKSIPQTISNNVLFKWGLDVEESKDLKQYLNKINAYNSLDDGFYDRIHEAALKISTPKEDASSTAQQSDEQIFTNPNAEDILDFFDTFSMNSFEGASVIYPSL
ncbi:putative transcriptional regulatory protein YCR106W [Kluyveromyces marxianus]|uniref:Transcriptional regulatory protein YCR106W n=1 Tax=Kluyveromyces marxianus TaxID=4911 RepID=A0ABX6EZI1_KLUMA|nr:putative transcriptional regulatory protein YCR106W [Kluyveromyces marxianus]